MSDGGQPLDLGWQINAKINAYACEFQRLNEVIGVAFIGPMKAGKSTIINLLLSVGQPNYLEIMPTNVTAETNVIWKVYSVKETDVQITLHGQLQQGIRLTTINQILEYTEKFSRGKEFQHEKGPIEIGIPLNLLNPFCGQHYRLIDTPGVSESPDMMRGVESYLSQEVPMIAVVCPLNGGKPADASTSAILVKHISKRFFVLSKYDQVLNEVEPKRGETSKSQVMNRIISTFQNEIRKIDPTATIFTFAAGPRLYQTQSGRDAALQSCTKNGLTGAQIQVWFQSLHDHIVSLFIEDLEKHAVLLKRAEKLRQLCFQIDQEYLRYAGSPHHKLEALAEFDLKSETLKTEFLQRFESEVTQRLTCLKGKDNLMKIAHKVDKEKVKRVYFYRSNYCRDLLNNMSQELRVMISAIIIEACENQGKNLSVETEKLIASLSNFKTEEGAKTSARAFAHTDTKYPTNGAAVLGVAHGIGAGLLAMESGATVALAVGAAVAVVFVAIGLAVGGVVYAFGNTTWTRKKAIEEVVADLNDRFSDTWLLVPTAATAKVDQQVTECFSNMKLGISQEFMKELNPSDVEQRIPEYKLFCRLNQHVSKVYEDCKNFFDTSIALACDADLERCEAELLPNQQYSQVETETSQYLTSDKRHKLNAIQRMRVMLFNAIALIHLERWQDVEKVVNAVSLENASNDARILLISFWNLKHHKIETTANLTNALECCEGTNSTEVDYLKAILLANCVCDKQPDIKEFGLKFMRMGEDQSILSMIPASLASAVQVEIHSKRC
eukprot:c3114_g1_i2.p1 GENE.c3114_g1_i2~~c3114_g1_i2.p1  ORF type:complete len:826 (-),score=142.94 c3114_g1_i2:32-2374(-)